MRAAPQPRATGTAAVAALAAPGDALFDTVLIVLYPLSSAPHLSVVGSCPLAIMFARRWGENIAIERSPSCSPGCLSVTSCLSPPITYVASNVTLEWNEAVGASCLVPTLHVRSSRPA